MTRINRSVRVVVAAGHYKSRQTSNKRRKEQEEAQEAQELPSRCLILNDKHRTVDLRGK